MNPAEEYIFKQPEPFRAILLHLQIIIETTVTSVELKYKYKIPFYYIGNRPFCYLNKTKKYVDVGFLQANKINIHQNYLVTDGRKVIKSLRYYKIDDIQDSILIDILEEAKSFYILKEI